MKQQKDLDTRLIVLKKDLFRELPGLCAALVGPEARFIVISDERIWKATEARRKNFPENLPGPPAYLLPAEPEPYAEYGLIEKIKTVILESKAVPLAFGSGTVNDVVKRASFEAGLRYICVPTAPSVDGYSAFGAAVSVEGFKRTLECTAPLAVAADEDVILEAPLPMISAGYADLLAKIMSGIDWVIADALEIEALNREVWESIREKAAGVLAKASLVKKRDPALIKELYEGLIISGLGMQIYKGSRPASGSEHQFSHVWEMDHLTHNGGAISHGFRVALGSLLSCALMTELFRLETPEIEVGLERTDDLLLERRLRQAERYLYGGKYYENTVKMIREKTPAAPLLAARREKIRKVWKLLRAKGLELLPPYEKLKKSLAEAGCPSEPADIGLDRERLRFAVVAGQLIRTRYTALDLMAETGLLDPLTEKVFAGNYFTRYSGDRR